MHTFMQHSNKNTLPLRPARTDFPFAMGSTWEVSKKYNQLTNCTPRQCTTCFLSPLPLLFQFIFCQSGRTQVSIIFIAENIYEMRFTDCQRVLIGPAVSKLDKKSHFLTASHSLPCSPLSTLHLVCRSLTAQSYVQIFSNSSTKLCSTHTITINLGSALAGV